LPPQEQRANGAIADRTLELEHRADGTAELWGRSLGSL
jgi:hypothetical protein